MGHVVFVDGHLDIWGSMGQVPVREVNNRVTADNLSVLLNVGDFVSTRPRIIYVMYLHVHSAGPQQRGKIKSKLMLCPDIAI